ncbi:hypothetical protein KIW84_065077 [Lathyrus oleraceus]|uniref:Uncharacterized protein n=1 Tax=Pisum sativum TaxID=3888 RepID=A0A9D4WG03_PEA|nr:hypothetical protein KIW84_065077 [Pisum sativum]
MAHKDKTENLYHICRSSYGKECIMAMADNCRRLAIEMNSHHRMELRKMKICFSIRSTFGGMASAFTCVSVPTKKHPSSRKTQHDANKEKAVVLYKPDAHLPEVNGNTLSKGNSIVQLLKVLEARKSVLQKEQGMAFARAVAAGFEIDYIPALMSFAECFGASRLMDASAKFRDLWKRKHEMDNNLKLKLLK